MPATGADWNEVHRSANAFLNSRGGILILGARETGTGKERRYVLDGWKDHAEPKIKEFPRLFTDRKGVRQEPGNCFPLREIRTLLGARVAVVYVDELASDQKFGFLHGTAYRRILTGDHKLTDRDIEVQEEFKAEAAQGKELQPVPDMREADLDLTKLNEFIFHLNQPKQVETLKPDIDSARLSSNVGVFSRREPLQSSAPWFAALTRATASASVPTSTGTLRSRARSPKTSRISWTTCFR